jgi:sigma-E factor negative regulatory protein RseC
LANAPGDEMANADEHDGLARAVVTVVSVEGQKALVDTTGSNSCESCAGSGGCGTQSLMALFGAKNARLRIDNVFEAKAGDRLEIGIEQIKILKMSALSYLMPLIGLMGGGLIGAASNSSDAVSFGFGLIGLLIAFAYSRYLFTSSRWEREISPVCLRRVSSGDERYIDPEVIR